MKCAALLASVCVVLGALGGWETAHADEPRVYVAAFAGIAEPEDLQNVKFSSGMSTANQELGRDPLFGGKIGWKPSEDLTWFGLELEGFWVPGEVDSGQVLGGAKLATFVLGFNTIFRYPMGPLQPYVGVGPSVVWSESVQLGGKATAVGFNAMVGLRLTFGDRAFIFGEYKHNRSELDYPSATVGYRLHALAAGVAIMF
jgi:hypothetical protein